MNTMQYFKNLNDMMQKTKLSYQPCKTVSTLSSHIYTMQRNKRIKTNEHNNILPFNAHTLCIHTFTVLGT